MTKSTNRIPRLAAFSGVALSLVAVGLARSGMGASTPMQEPGAGVDKITSEMYQPYCGVDGFRGERYQHNFTFVRGGGALVQRMKRERSTASGPWAEATDSESTAYLISDIAATNGGDLLYVGGVDAKTGHCLIEQWQYRSRKNGWMVSFPLPPAVDSLGVPAPPAIPVLTTTSGNAWEIPAAHEYDLSPARRTKVLGSDAGPFFGLDVDPQGRYLITFDVGNAQLLQIDLTASPATSAVIGGSGTSLPVAKAGSIRIMDFEGEGRKILICPAGTITQDNPEFFIVGSDSENDGLFEAWQSFDSTTWEASPYSDWDKWTQFYKT